MTLAERKASLVQQINGITDEQTLKMLEVTIGYYADSNGSDITDGLSAYQPEELTSHMEEPSEKDTISEEEFNNLFARWGTK